MKRTSILSSATGIAIAAATFVVAAQAQPSTLSPTTAIKSSAMSSNYKSQVNALLKAIETGETAPVAVINPHKYIQHNLGVANGLAGFGAVLQALPKGSARVNTVRVFQDSNFVFAHTEYNFFGPKVGFDIFRFEDGKIVEHWDNLQETPAIVNPSGRSMTDGQSTVQHLQHTEENKTMVAAFVDDILVNGRMTKIGQYIDADNYRQHNPQIADGLQGLGAALEAMARAGVSMKYTTVHKVLGEGDFVLTVSEGEFAGKPTAFYDLFRVNAGKLVEHWDVIETIPARTEWKNANGKFGF